MANTITTTTLVDGARNLVVLVNISGDGSGEETGTVILDRSSFSGGGTETVVEGIEGSLAGFAATLSFDATSALQLAALPNGNPFDYDWCTCGGVSSNKAGAGATGDILLTTSGLGSGETGTFTIFARKS